jgi:hypothetical protein
VLGMHLPHQLICYLYPFSSSCCSAYLSGLQQVLHLLQPRNGLPASAKCAFWVN